MDSALLLCFKVGPEFGIGVGVCVCVCLCMGWQLGSSQERAMESNYVSENGRHIEPRSQLC